MKSYQNTVDGTDYVQQACLSITINHIQLCYSTCFGLAEVVLSACEQAFSSIDMNNHEGIHPCMGAVDLIPLYPLGDEVGLEDCGREVKGKVKMSLNLCYSVILPFAWVYMINMINNHHLSLALATALIEKVPGTSAFFFGWADTSLHRSLAQRRKEMGWFRKIPKISNIRPDIGPVPSSRYGLTGKITKFGS